MVQSVKGDESSGGRKPALVSINPGIGLFLAVDFADGNSTVALADGAFRFQAMESIPLLLRDGPAKILAEVTKWARRTLTRKSNLSGIAISVPGPVDKRTGLLVHPPALSGWEGFSFTEFFRESFNVPVFVQNDANMMALGELWASRRAAECSWDECWVVVKLSASGIGAGIISEGRLYSGAAGGAGEIGHIQVVPDGLRCRCGLRGCLETVAAAPAILEQARQRSAGDLRTVVSQNQPARTVRELARAALNGDEIANSLIQKAGTHIGEVLGVLVNVLNPTRILIGGDFANVGPTMLASIRQGVFARALPLMSRQLAVEPCRGSNSEILGCIASTFIRVVCEKESGGGS
jgi:predicted NBD/HSP70 family sugar kinase